MTAAPFDDDFMALADAVGVTAHPHLDSRLFADDTLAAVLANWTRAAAGPLFEVDLDIDPDVPIGLVVAEESQLDHAPCANDDCTRTVCGCSTPCAGLSEVACLHHLVLCDDCRTECPDCRDDAAYDGQGWDL